MTALNSDSAVAFMEEMAKYWSNPPSNGEDASFWANANNSANCLLVAGMLKAPRAAKEPIHWNGDFEYINDFYNLDIGMGTPVTYTGESAPKNGIVVGAHGARVRLLFDGENVARGPFHPTWQLKYG